MEQSVPMRRTPLAPAEALSAPRSPLTSDGPGTPGAAVPSSALLQGRKTVHIEHNGALYQLRATKFGKLILTK